MRWAALAKDVARGQRLPGILPPEDVLLYGQKSLLLIAHFQMTDPSRSTNIRHALERFTCAFESLSLAHSKNITINLWPEHFDSTVRDVFRRILRFTSRRPEGEGVDTVWFLGTLKGPKIRRNRRKAIPASVCHSLSSTTDGRFRPG